MRKSDYHYLLGLLKDNAGWDFDDDEYFIIDKKMYNFVREKGYASVEELIAELKMGQKALLWQVVEALALSETSFYRDYKVFKNFEDTILPHIRELNRGAKNSVYGALAVLPVRKPIQSPSRSETSCLMSVTGISKLSVPTCRRSP